MADPVRVTAPFGRWESPVTADLVAGQTIGLGALQADGDTLFWLEARPAEAGRSVLVRRMPDGGIADLTPPPFNVASRVHEYGGGAYTVRDGRVAFSDKHDDAVWLIEDGAEPRRIAAVPGCRYADFRFDPSGRHLYCVREDARDPAREAIAAIVAFDLRDAAAPEANAGRVLVSGPDFLSSPRPSPDGTRLAWIAWDHPDMPWDATRLYEASLRDGRIDAPRLVAGGARESIVQPDWSPDGVLHACSDRDGWWNLYRAQPDGLEAVCPMRSEIGLPHWVFGQRSYGFAPDGTVVAARIDEGRTEPVAIRAGRPEVLPYGLVADALLILPQGVAFLATPPDAPPELRLVRPGGEAQTLRRAGPATLAAGDVSVAETIRFPTDDGHLGHAFLYAPASSRFAGPEDERPPLIVISHGGPTGMSGPGFSPRVQWWTSRGYAVLDVNYGGSTGFGREYRARLDGRWGVVDVADCVAAARHVIAAGRVDGARTAIRGGSAGGFTTLAALTGSDLFRAGASHYGVADLMLLAGDTHKFESRYLDRLVGPLPESEALYRRRSPIEAVDRLSCPVIFFQGLDDKVVPPNQARAMAAAMAARGLYAPLHEFEGEGHGFRRAETVRRVLDLETAFYERVFEL